jgi:hypothetical protein
MVGTPPGPVNAMNCPSGDHDSESRVAPGPRQRRISISRTQESISAARNAATTAAGHPVEATSRLSGEGDGSDSEEHRRAETEEPPVHDRRARGRVLRVGACRRRRGGLPPLAWRAKTAARIALAQVGQRRTHGRGVGIRHRGSVLS